MKNRTHSTLIARSIISLLLILSCVAMPTVGPLRAAAISSTAGDTQQVAARGEAVKSSNASGPPFKSLPLRFELNAGQTDSQVRFIARNQGGDMFLTARELVLRVFAPATESASRPGVGLHQAAPSHALTDSAVVRLQTVNANPTPRISGLDPLPGRTNYFIGNDPKKWHTNVPSYSKVKYENIYPGIDLIYYGNEGNLEYDFNVAAGADPSQIALSVEGTDGVNIDAAGNLVLHTAVGEVSQHAPHIYQQAGAERREVAGSYVLRDDGRVAFDLAGYDASKPLVIDPELVYATYFGGSAETDIKAIAVDAAGSVYVAGDTFAHDFPTKNPLQSTNNHRQSLSAVVTKFSPDGASLVYSTYLGGSTDFTLDIALGIALDSAGAAYITGTAGSADFPTKNPIQGARAAGSTDLFISKISADGSSLLYSTYLGGSDFDEPVGIKLDSFNAAYVFGQTRSSDFPLMKPTQATFAGGFSDGFLAIINGNGTQLLFSTFIGGPGDDAVSSCGIDSGTGNVYLGGYMRSPNQTMKSSAIGPQAQGSFGKYIEKLKRLFPQDYELAKDYIQFILTDPNGRSLSDEMRIEVVEFFINQQREIRLGIVDTGLSGLTFIGNGSQNGPQPNQALASPPGVKLQAADPGARITLTNLNLSVERSVHFGGGFDTLTALTGDARGAVYVVGSTNSINFPTVNPIQATYGGSIDTFVAVFAPGTLEEVFATYIGGSGHDQPKGIALDPQGNIYIAGQTTSPDFPTRNAYQSTPPAPNGVQQGQGNSFIVKISAIGPIQTGPDFSLGFDAPTLTVQAGVKAKIKVNINRTGGFTGNVTIAPGHPGNGIKPKPAASITTTDASVTFKYKTGAAVPGQYPITFTGTDDSGHTRTATVTLIIQ
jgi:hypothetical protein